MVPPENNMSTVPAKITKEELTSILLAQDPAVVLLPVRIIRRVVWQSQSLNISGFQLLRCQSFMIDRETFLQYVHADELNGKKTEDLPNKLILLAEPEEEKELDRLDTLQTYWQRLFHCRVRLEVEENFSRNNLENRDVLQRIDLLGFTEFEEIKMVLTRENQIYDPKKIETIYSRFVAFYLELQFFAPHLLTPYFPALHGRKLDDLFAMDVNAEKIFTETRLPGITEPTRKKPKRKSHRRKRKTSALVNQNKFSRWRNKLRIKKAVQAGKIGNPVRAAILHKSLIKRGSETEAEKAADEAQKEVINLTLRLKEAIDLTEEEVDKWQKALLPLLEIASRGFFNPAARLLYDLQNVCMDREKGIFSVSLSRWLFSFGKKEMRREITAIREVRPLKHLKSAYHRLALLDLTYEQRHRLVNLFQQLIDRWEDRVRQYFRPIVEQCLQQVDFTPRNVPERVARDKVKGELVDCIVENGILIMPDVRDAIARNQLKLGDLSSPKNFLVGDSVHQLNRIFTDRLEGVYRPGEFYLRWLQSFTSLSFGTKLGRFLTKYFAVPFGGAFVALKGLYYLYLEILHFLPKGGGSDHTRENNPMTHPEPAIPDHLTTPWSVGIIGLFIFLLIHNAGFRNKVGQGFVWLGKGLKFIFYDVPAAFGNLPIVKRIIGSAPLLFFNRYLLKPLILAGLSWMIARLWQIPLQISNLLSAIVFLLVVFFFNTRLGRLIDEYITDWIVSGLNHIGIELIPALLATISEWFKKVVGTAERFLYGIDQYFRFRTSDSSLSLGIKAVFGFFWSGISYLFRFLIVLIVEPTVNPIKHFPVVTVAGKFMLPLLAILPSIFITQLGMDPYLAGLLTSAIVFGTPGIFGFLVWELKEGWRLYEANRQRNLKAIPVGSHGETILRLLKPGFHSGTVPTIFRKMRSAARKGKEKSLHRCEEKRIHVVDDVNHFVEREFIELLRYSRTLAHLTIYPKKIELANTRVSIELVCSQFPDAPAVIHLDHRQGWLLGDVSERGWLEQLEEKESQVVEYALSGFFKLCGVVILDSYLRSKLEEKDLQYTVGEKYLILWPNGDFSQPLEIALRPNRTEEKEANLNRANLLYSEFEISWDEWVQAWEKEQTNTTRESTIAEPTKQAQPTV